jgi:hypothetical protein
MVNYQLGKIYTVRSLTSPEIYVGSTVAPLCKRMAQHRSDWKNGLIIGLHKEIVYDINEWFIELYELFPCNLKCELEKREGEVIRQIGTLNNRIAGRTNKEWRIDNKDKMKEWRIKNADKIKEENKEYRIENADKIKEQNKEYRIENADKIKEQNKQYRIEKVDKIKEYYIDNADKLKEYSKEYRIKKKLAKSQPITE